jgi:hypothetical protein
MKASKKLKPVSILSMAVAATLTAKAAHGAVLSLYYDNINDVTDGQSYSYASTGGNYSAIPTTIHIGVGDTVEFGIDAVVTNNVNPDGGTNTGTPGHLAVQPSFLGLSTLSIKVSSSDTNAHILAPNTTGGPTQTFGGNADFNDSISLNNQGGLGDAQGNNSGSNPFVPVWSNNTPGDVVPGSATAGDIGDHFAIFQGNGAIASNTKAGANTIGEYGAATATYANATDFFSQLSYTALYSGTVTLSPQVVAAGSSYWTNTRAGSSSIASGYIASTFTNPGDVIGTLPVLVIHVGEPIGRPIISLTPASSGAPTTYGDFQGALTVTGNNGSYHVAQLTGLNATTGFVEANGFNPGTDEEIFALDVLVNGVQANAAQISLLVNTINFGDFNVRPSYPLEASATYAGLPTTDASPFGSQYNLFLDSASGPSSDNFFGIDLSNSDDDNLTGYTFSAIAVVPEPMSLGLIALGSLSLLTRRPCRQK